MSEATTDPSEWPYINTVRLSQHATQRVSERLAPGSPLADIERQLVRHVRRAQHQGALSRVAPGWASYRGMATAGPNMAWVVCHLHGRLTALLVGRHAKSLSVITVIVNEDASLDEMTQSA